MKLLDYVRKKMLGACAGLVLLGTGVRLINVHRAHVDQGLVDAVTQGNLASAHRLLAEGAQVDVPVLAPVTKPTPATYFHNSLHGILRAPHRAKTTPLMLAVASGQRDMADLLLRYHAQVDPRDEYGFTPLSMALSVRRPNLVRLLLAHGADPNAVNDLNMPPLCWALLMRQTDSALALIEAKADPNAKDDDGMTALYLAELEQEPRVAQALLSHGADPNSMFEGFSVLRLAEEQGDSVTVQVLRHLGAHSFTVPLSSPPASSPHQKSYGK